MTRKRKVVFLHRKLHATRGSKIMRCDQLSDICSQFLGETHEFSVRQLPKQHDEDRQLEMAKELTDHIVVFLKYSMVSVLPGPLDELRSRSAGICIDYVDAPVNEATKYQADVHIAASATGQRALEAELRQRFSDEAARKNAVMLVNHHADPRITWHDHGAANQLSACYLGDQRNTVIPAALGADVLIIDTALARNKTWAFEQLSGANLHYGVRRVKRAGDLRAFKPFTKGFNAAAAGANIIVSRWENDAADILGSGYPFFLDGETEEDIILVFQKVKSLFGGPEWRDGLERMTHARELSRPSSVARDMARVLSYFG